MATVTIGDRGVGPGEPTYFIAEIGSNHDGDLERALELIRLAKACGAEAAKFQNFTAETIVSEAGTQRHGEAAHQAAWKKSVLEVYREAETPPDWTPVLAKACREEGLHYLSSPYDLAAVDLLDPHVPAHKVGSGDLTWLEALAYIATKGKPVLLATGAAELGQVQAAVDTILTRNRQLVLLQCNTNYSGSADTYQHQNLRVLTAYATLWPEAVLGYSDHTPGHAAVLGAVALGARVIEKHFTDDPTRDGPDHGFALSPRAFKDMVDSTRELEAAMGSSAKTVCENERTSLPLQRRSIYAAEDVPAGAVVERAQLAVLRPQLSEAIGASLLRAVVGRTLAKPLTKGQPVKWSDLA